jgi:putative oxidoreductase
MATPSVHQGRDRDVVLVHPVLPLTGRIMFTLIFFLSGVTHFTDLETYAALMPAAIPWRPFWVAISGVVELVGAGLLVTDRYPRLGAWLLVLFLIPVTATVHGVAMLVAPDPTMRRIQVSFFLKGVAMTGAALVMTQYGIASRKDR